MNTTIVEQLEQDIATLRRVAQAAEEEHRATLAQLEEAQARATTAEAKLREVEARADYLTTGYRSLAEAIGHPNPDMAHTPYVLILLREEREKARARIAELEGALKKARNRCACRNYGWVTRRGAEVVAQGGFTDCPDCARIVTLLTPSDQGTGGEARLVIPPLNDALREILGRPNFACGALAQALRAAGTEIASKAEAEQAAVLHWLLRKYAEHGGGWREAAAAELTGQAPQEKAEVAR